MKRIAFVAVLFLITVSVRTSAEKITFVPQWIPQAQFAGYYAAYENGFYADEGLDVNIVHMGMNSTGTAQDMLASGRAQIVGMQMLQALVERSKGNPIVNVMQLTQNTGLCCVSHTPISKFSDLKDKKVGRWKMGFSEICEIVSSREKVDVDWISFVNGINLYVYGAVDAMLCFCYSEYIRILLATGEIPDGNVIRFSELGYDIPEDGLYVSEEFFKENEETVRKFVYASQRGWNWVRENREEALRITKKYSDEAHVVTNGLLEKMMLDEYLELQNNHRTNGTADYAPVSEDVFDGIVSDMYNSGMIDRKIEYKDFVK